MKPISIVDDELRLCSNLDEYSFGKTNYDSIVSQEAYLFDGKNFAVWNFEDVKSFSNEDSSDEEKNKRIVYYCGKNPLSNKARTLLEYFDEADNDLFRAVELVTQAITNAAKNGNKIPVNGAGGILVDLSSDKEKVLFLPYDLFKYSVAGLSKEEYTNQNGGWINETLSGLPALCFERAVIIYKLLTGRFPFPAVDIVERNADILDRKFLPLEMSIEGIDSKLSYEINKALKLNSNAVNIPGKKQKGKSSEELIPTADFPLELLNDAYNTAKNSENTSGTSFEEKAAAYIKAQTTKINTKRKIRRNSATIAAVTAVSLLLSFLIYDTVKSRNTDYTSKGLTSVQTIQGFLYGANTKKNTLMSNLVKGRQPQKFIDTISQVFVLDKQRKTYNRDNGFASPENWLLYSTDELNYNRSGVYGVSNVRIDNKPYELTVRIYQKNEHPDPVLQEGNITLKNNSESVHKVQYYLIHTEETGFIVEDITEFYTLQYIKDRWMITNIETDSTVVPVKSNTFKNDYFNQLAFTNGDVVQAVNNLRGKYKWLPTEESIVTEQKAIEYRLLHPFDDLGF